MRKYILVSLLLICFLQNQSEAQKRYIRQTDIASWRQFLKDSIFKNSSTEYITVIKYQVTTSKDSTQELKNLGNITYLIQNNKPVVVVVYGDTMATVTRLDALNLFDSVKANKSSLNALKEYVSKTYLFEKKLTDEKRNMTNGTTITQPLIISHLGIRYKNKVWFNHFPKFSQNEIERTKQKKVKEGMLVINRLYEILENLQAENSH